MKKTLMFPFAYPCSNKTYEGSIIKLTLPVEDIEIDGIDTRDAPDFCDAFISYASVNGRPATEAELDQLQDDTDLVYSEVEKALY